MIPMRETLVSSQICVSILTQSTTIVVVKVSLVPNNVSVTACKPGVAIVIYNATIPSRVDVVVPVRRSGVRVVTKNSMTTCGAGIDIVVTVGVASIIAGETRASVIDGIVMVAEMVVTGAVFIVTGIVLA